MTLNNLQRRGMIGSGFCVLCNEGLESSEHLLFKCKYVVEVWNETLLTLKINLIQHSGSLDNYIKKWFYIKKNCKTLPFFILWTIWGSSNATIFDQKVGMVRNDINKIIAIYEEMGPSKRNKGKRLSNTKIYGVAF